jgi:hypothetical protein
MEMNMKKKDSDVEDEKVRSTRLPAIPRFQPRFQQVNKTDPKRAAALKKMDAEIGGRATKEDRFVYLIQHGHVWSEAVIDSGIDHQTAAKIVEQMFQFRMDGVAVFLLSESYLKQALEGLKNLGDTCEDEKVRVVALSKLAEISLKVLNNKPWIKEMQRFPLPEDARQFYKNTVWDAAFED